MTRQIFPGELLAVKSGVRVFAPARGMVDGDDDDFVCRIMHCVKDEVRIPPRDDLPHALHFLLVPAPGKQQVVPKRFINSVAHP